MSHSKIPLSTALVSPEPCAVAERHIFTEYWAHPATALPNSQNVGNRPTNVAGEDDVVE